MRMIDTHLHVIERSRLGYPWLPGVPALDRDHPYALWECEARRVGITDALHMEVDVAEDDIDREIEDVRALSQRPGSLVRGAIAACRPEAPDFAERLERHLADPLVRGLRRVLHVVPDAVSVDPAFRAAIGRLGNTRLVFDIVMFPHQLGLAAALADACPNTRFVLDHCGNPPVAGGLTDTWRNGIADVARRENVCVKISGVLNNCDAATWTLDDIRPAFEHVVACFGWSRVVWGSDWPVVTLGGSLSTWVAASRALVADCSAGEQQALFCDNARRIWGID